jgi:hypothetical protein
MLRLYIIGLCILIAAILLNGIAAKLGLMSWYDFLTQLSNQGKLVFSRIRLVDYLWLLMGYPFLLGTAAYAADLLYRYCCK